MVLICISTTHPVNPPGSTPRLSHADLWAALVSKARHPEEFVAAIEKSTIVHEDQTGLTRRVLFKGDLGRDGEVEEVIRYVGDMKIDFRVPQTGQFVSNIISGLASYPEELLLTFTFEWSHPEITAGNDAEVKKLREQYLAMSRAVVPRTVEVAREMKVQGRLH